ncbi:uncharacterized protein LOC121386274 isoform X2 [Gigantopelta aegis]|uniref:uncharacterized protein LOC121386274 isoform X2 n=1 Tax=Gigantopelta aegis TaxID=1735272 RepID=UPI001B888DA9|nr:uncharacterized protein LOC121386274 isoform X2 [Gigantopelta aegis]
MTCWINEVISLSDTVECKASSMKITLYPAGTFNGVIYVDGKKDKEGCTFPDSNGTLELDLLDTACGEVTSNPESGDRSRVIKMQYSSNYITDRDTKLTVTCSSGAGTVDVTAAFTSQGSDGNTKEQAIHSTADIVSDAVDFVIKLKDGSVVSSSTVVSLNDQLTFQFNVDSEKVPGGVSCEYTRNPGISSGSMPSKVKSNATLEECKNACNAESQCKSLDYVKSSMNCYMFHFHVVLLDRTQYVDHYVKNCGSVTVTQCEASNGQSEDNKETMKLIENRLVIAAHSNINITCQLCSSQQY